MRSAVNAGGPATQDPLGGESDAGFQLAHGEGPADERRAFGLSASRGEGSEQRRGEQAGPQLSARQGPHDHSRIRPAGGLSSLFSALTGGRLR